MKIDHRIAEITGSPVRTKQHFSGGCVGDVMLAQLDDGQRIVIKQSGPGSDAVLDIEGRMLTYLTQHSPIPVPTVLYSDPGLLVMSFIENDGLTGRDTQRDLAQKLAAQHAITQSNFGLDFDTVIGGLHQRNTPTSDWIAFFGTHRLLFMAETARKANRLSADLHRRIEALIPHLGDFIPTGTAPSLLHGDLWGGNILCHQGRISGLIDPAIYYGDAEIELAFGTLFGDLGPEFFEHYQKFRPLQPGFFETRRDLYNLYPLLVHVRLFGGSYLGAVDRILTKLGF